MKSQIDALENAYQALLFGVSNPFQARIEDVQRQLSAAGIQDILDEINRQLAVWQES